VFSPPLFIIFLEAVIAIALDNSHSGAVISGVVTPDLRFADDIAFLSENVSDLQVTVNCIAQTAKNLGIVLLMCQKLKLSISVMVVTIFRYT